MPLLYPRTSFSNKISKPRFQTENRERAISKVQQFTLITHKNSRNLPHLQTAKNSLTLGDYSNKLSGQQKQIHSKTALNFQLTGNFVVWEILLRNHGYMAIMQYFNVWESAIMDQFVTFQKRAYSDLHIYVL